LLVRTSPDCLERVQHSSGETHLYVRRDALSPSEDFIISAHSASKNLYIATIGSFHGWKFLPVLGKYVVQLLQGSLDEKWAKKWAWDKALPPPPVYGWPRKELSEFV